MTWTEVEKMENTTGNLTYEIHTMPEGASSERCGFLRCVVNLIDVTDDSVRFNMSVSSIQIANGIVCPVGGVGAICSYTCEVNPDVRIDFAIAFPSDISEYETGNAWVFYQEI